MCLKVEYDEQGCFLESPYLFGEDQKYAHYMQVSPTPLIIFFSFFSQKNPGPFFGLLIFQLHDAFFKSGINCLLQFARVNSVVTMVLGGAGIFGNLLSVIVLSRSRFGFLRFSFCICILYLYL